MTHHYTPHVCALLTVSLAGVLLAASPAAAASDCDGSTINGNNASVVTGSCLVPAGVTWVRIDAIGGGGGGGASSLGNAAGRGGHAAMVTTYQEVTSGAELSYTVGGGGGGGLNGGAAGANTFGGVGFTAGGIPGPIGTSAGGLTKATGGGGGGSTRVVSGTDVDVIAGGGGGGGGVAAVATTKGGDAAAAGTAAGQAGSSSSGRGGGGANPPTGGTGATGGGTAGGNGTSGTGGNGGPTGASSATPTGGGGGGGYGGGGGGGGAALSGGGGSGGSYRGGVGAATATTTFKAVSTGAGKGGDGGGASAATAGTAGSVTITPLPCGPGIGYATGLWQQLALPCVPSASQPYVDSVFGSGTLADLNSDNYNVTGTGWLITRFDADATPPAYVRLKRSTDTPTADDALSAGTGYFIKSYQAPTGGQVTITGTATVIDVTEAQGCAVSAGCKAVPVSTTAPSRYSLLGNPFPYAVDWAQVRVQVGGTIYTPSEAETARYLSATIWIWDGTQYVTKDDSTPGMIGNLLYFKSFWVELLSGGQDQTIRLLIPAAATTHSQALPAASAPLAAQPLPWYLGWQDWPAQPAAAAPVVHGLAEQAAEQAGHTQALATGAEWSLRLTVDNHVTGWQDHNSVLGQLANAAKGYDRHDLRELPPFAKPYLTLVFPHPDWGDRAGDYASDYRPAEGLPPDRWTFEIHAQPVGSKVFLHWEGDPALLQRSRLINLQTGETLKPADSRWARKGYPVTLKTPVTRFVWRYLGAAR